MNELVRYDAMCSAIAECHAIDEVKDLRDKAMALELYAKQAQNVEAERKACEVRLRAERRTGELLKELARATPQAAGTSGGHAKAGTSNDATRQQTPYADALHSTGISRQTAHRYQALANVPKEAFEAALREPEKPTTNGILRAANGAPRMDDGALWLWGRLRDFERDGLLHRNAQEVFGGMTQTMQADVQRILPSLLDWLHSIEEVNA